MARLAEAAELLRSARSPVLWLGNGVKLAEAGDQALDLARALDMPVITTFNGIGAVPTSDPIVYGVLSRMGTELSTRVLADADVVVAVGNSFNAISTSRWTVKLPQKIIQIDLDPSILGRYYADRTVGILGDARSALNELHGMLAKPNSDPASAKARKDRLASLATVREAWRKKAVQENTAAAGQISPDTVVTAVRKVTPADAIAVFDAGNPGVWSYLWEIEKIDTYLKPVGYGNMGFAVPAAIATKVVRPETPVVVFVGDGSLGMTLGELETVAREKLPMCIVVMNDRGYGNIRQEQIVHFEGRTVGVDFTDADYAAVARAQGLEAVRVTTVADLTKAVENAFSSGRPWLVEALIDPDVNAWTYPLFRRYQAA
jgi:acetolactate synthase-1/2/3 large subunit